MAFLLQYRIDYSSSSFHQVFFFSRRCFLGFIGTVTPLDVRYFPALPMCECAEMDIIVPTNDITMPPYVAGGVLVATPTVAAPAPINESVMPVEYCLLNVCNSYPAACICGCE